MEKPGVGCNSLHLPFFEKVIALVIYDYKSREILHLNLPNGLHTCNYKYHNLVKMSEHQVALSFAGRS